jgi:hypothetical protein
LGLNHIWTKREIQLKTGYIQKLKVTNDELIRVKNNLLSNYSAEDFVNDLVDTCLVENLEGEKQSFMNMFHGKKHLVLLFHEDVCPVCIELEIERLAKITKPDKILFVTSKTNRRFAKVLQAQHKFDYKMFFWSPPSFFDSSKREGNLPLYFISDGITISHFFITDKSQPRLTEYYLKYIFKHL